MKRFLAVYDTLHTPLCGCDDCFVCTMYAAEKKAVSDVVEARGKVFKRASFNLHYMDFDPDYVAQVSGHDLRGEYSRGNLVRQVRDATDGDDGHLFVSLGDVAADGDDMDVTLRSNFRSLKRDFPDFPWVEVTYSHPSRTDLGCFIADIDDDMEGTLIGLGEEYSIFDESDHSELEQDDIYASWEAFQRSDIYRSMNDGTKLIWDGLGDEAVTKLWWECVREDVFSPYPEHGGDEVRWGNDVDRIAEFRPYLIRAYLAKQRKITPVAGWVGQVAQQERRKR